MVCESIFERFFRALGPKTKYFEQFFSFSIKYRQNLYKDQSEEIVFKDFDFLRKSEVSSK